MVGETQRPRGALKLVLRVRRCRRPEIHLIQIILA